MPYHPLRIRFALLAGKDWRSEPLTDRKQELRRLLAKVSPPLPLRYVDHVDGFGKALFERVCELDLEGIVAKHKSGPYVTDRESTTWFKILNRKYSQKQGREEFFERDRHREPVAVATRTSPAEAGARCCSEDGRRSPGVCLQKLASNRLDAAALKRCGGERSRKRRH